MVAVRTACAPNACVTHQNQNTARTIYRSVLRGIANLGHGETSTPQTVTITPIATITATPTTTTIIKGTLELTLLTVDRKSRP